jgi:hypothetical protein
MFPGDEGTFLSHDLHLLETMEFKQRVKHIGEIIEEVQWQDVDPDMLTRFVCLFVLCSWIFTHFHTQLPHSLSFSLQRILIVAEILIYIF